METSIPVDFLCPKEPAEAVVYVKGAARIEVIVWPDAQIKLMKLLDEMEPDGNLPSSSDK